MSERKSFEALRTRAFEVADTGRFYDWKEVATAMEEKVLSTPLSDCAQIQSCKNDHRPVHTSEGQTRRVSRPALDASPCKYEAAIKRGTGGKRMAHDVGTGSD